MPLQEIRTRRPGGRFVASIAALSLALPSTARQVPSEEVQERIKVAAANLEDAVVVDCQLPGKLQKLGGTRTYLTPGRLLRLAAVDCRVRGGEYTIGDLAGGNLSLQRWLPLAEKGDPEAQYYVARIYGNGMGGVTTDYTRAAEWYRKAADQGYKAAKMELGYMYEEGLGVQQDLLLALNLQREASGLGEDLDYARKITEAQQEAERRVAELDARLEEANLQLADLRLQLGRSSDELAANRARLARSENEVLDLRADLEAARSSPGGADGAKVRELQAALATREAALAAERERAAKLEGDLRGRQAELSESLARSQATSLELNAVLASRQRETQSLRTRLAQAEQRLQRSQAELSELRAGYGRDVEQLSAEREEIERTRSKASTDAAALVALKQRDIDRAQLRIKGLEAELAAARGAQKSAEASRAAAAGAQGQAAAQARQLAALQEKYDAQLRQLQAQRQQLASLRARPAPEQSAAMQQLMRELAARNSALDERQRRIASLESETGQLRGEVSRLRAQRSGPAPSAETEGLRNALRVAQQKLAEQREQVERLQTEAAAERARLIQDRDRLQREMLAGQRASQSQINSLRDEIALRQAALKIKEKRIGELEKQLEKDYSGMPVLAMRSPAPRATANPEQMRIIEMARRASQTEGGRWHALVIANSNYVRMGALTTPASDARAVADVLRQRYGFQVRQMNDATADQLMMALHDYGRTLGAADNLLVYYAGHGGTADGPPERAFWLGIEANPETQTGWISAETIRAKIKQIPARRILLVADSCFSGAIAHPRSTTIGRGVSERRFQIQWQRRARVVLTSGQNTPVVDISGDRNHSLFARYFIQILRQSDNVLSGEMLAYELNQRMQPDAARMGVKQAPTYSELKDANHDLGDFYFIPLPARVASL